MLVSVVVSYRNPGDLLGEALRSVLAQSYREIEVLAIDRGSTDESSAIAEALPDPRIRLFRTESACAGAAWNLGFREAHGEWLQFLDATDRLHQQKIERQISSLPAAGEDTLSVSDLRVLRDMNGPSGGRQCSPPEGLDDPVRFALAMLRDSAGVPPVRPAQWMASRRLLERVGPWNEDLERATEMEYFARISLAARSVEVCREAVAFFREIGHQGEARQADVALSADATDATVKELRASVRGEELRAEIDATAAALHRRHYVAAWPAFPSAARRARKSVRALRAGLAPLPLEEVGLDREVDKGHWRRKVLGGFVREGARKILGLAEPPLASAWRYREATISSQVEILDQWNEVLPIPARSIEETFGECGGDPVLAGELIGRIERLTGLRMEEVLDTDTVETLAWKLFHEAAQHPRERVRTVEARTSEPGLPLVFFHGDLNGASCWVDRFVDRIAEQRTVHVVEPPNPDVRSDRAHATTAASVAPAFDAICQRIGSGPALIGGYCNGGVMALETACQLRACGAEIPGVIALDATIANSAILRARRIVDGSARWLGWGPTKQSVRTMKAYFWYFDWVMRWICLSRRPRDYGYFERGQQARFHDEFSLRIRKYFNFRYWGAVTSLYGSIPQVFDGRLVHSRADNRSLGLPVPPRKSWQRLAHEFVTLRSPGTHTTCVTRYQAELLAVVLPELARFDAEHPQHGVAQVSAA